MISFFGFRILLIEDEISTCSWGEHNNPNHDSAPAKHLSKYIYHTYNCTILANNFKLTRRRKNLEVIYIA